MVFKYCEKHQQFTESSKTKIFNWALETTSSFVSLRLCKSILKSVLGSLGRFQWSFSFWNPNRLVAELTLVPNWGSESLVSMRLVSLPVSQRWCWSWPARLFFQLALIVLCTSNKAAVNIDHNAVRIHTHGEDSQDRRRALSQEMLYNWKRDQDYYEHI